MGRRVRLTRQAPKDRLACKAMPGMVLFHACERRKFGVMYICVQGRLADHEIHPKLPSTRGRPPHNENVLGRVLVVSALTRRRNTPLAL